MRSAVLLLALFTPAAPAMADTPYAPQMPVSLRRSVDHEVSRLTLRSAQTATAKTQRRGWVRRHPVATAALVGGGSGFLIGYLPGDDGVFYDYTAGFNGLVVGGIGAGAAVAVVGVVRALRR